MAQSLSTNNVGEVYDRLFMSLLQGVDAFDKGLLSLVTGINEKLYLPQIEVSGSIVQAFTPTGVTTGSAGSLDYTEPTNIDPTDLTIKIDNIYPSAWRAVWEQFAPSTDIPFVELMLNPQVKEAFVLRVLQQARKTDAFTIWQGDTATGNTYQLYDGIIKKITSNGSTVDATTSGAAAFTDANIQSYLVDVYEQIVAQPALKSHPDLKIIVSHKTKSLYEDAEIAESGKGPMYSNMTAMGQQLMFKDVPVFASNGFPDDVIVATFTSPSPENSALHVGMRNANDMEAYRFEPLSDLSQYWGLRADYAIGTAITTPANIIYFDSRA